MTTIRERFVKAAIGEKIAVVLAGVVILGVIIIALVMAYNSWNKNRTQGTLQKNERTVATQQQNLDEEVQKREVETVRHESTITIRSESSARRVETVPVGQQLEPLLTELCGMHYYPSDPGCAGRVQRSGDGEEEVRRGRVADE